MPFTLNKILFLLLFTCLIDSNLLAQDMSQMKQYYFVLLSKGPNRNQDSATAAQIQKAHLENIGKLAKEGKLQVAGPFTDDGNFRGIFIFDAGSKEEVEQWVQTDEAIKSGRLSYEIHPWMTQKGNCFK
ncbi:MAG: YciI family protein [Bacteroidia bacterium]|nr:YciI family protein [Bacteroidia bacterium]